MDPVPPITVPVLERRRIELEIIAPVAKALEAEVGEPRAKEILSRAIAGVAEAQGRALRQALGQGGIGGIAALWERLAVGGALEVQIDERTAEAFRFRVTRCRYAEMYLATGNGPLGRILSCGRDAPLLGGFDPDLELEASGNLLDGDPCCRFTYRRRRTKE